MGTNERCRFGKMKDLPYRNVLPLECRLMMPLSIQVSTELSICPVLRAVRGIR